MAEQAMTTGRASSAPKETGRSLPIALLKAREAVMSHFRPMLAGHDVTEQQWRVIRVLAESGTLDASELAAKAFILAPSLTRMIKALESRGIIRRRADANDGRRVLLEMTPAGRKMIGEVNPDSSAIYANLDARFGRRRMEELLDMLETLSALGRPNGNGARSAE